MRIAVIFALSVLAVGCATIVHTDSPTKRPLTHRVHF